MQPVITERILSALASLDTGDTDARLVGELTPNELEILRLIAGRCSNREITVAIHKSEGTVKNQVSSIPEKLGVRGRASAALHAIDPGLL